MSKISNKKTTAKEDEIDPNEITWSGKDNFIQFRSRKIYFHFNCYSLYVRMKSLKYRLYNKDVGEDDLELYPGLIFEMTELKNYPDHAARVFNIIQRCISDIENNLHNGQKKRLFDGFLKVCEEKALAAKALQNKKGSIIGTTNGLLWEEIINPGLKSRFLIIQKAVESQIDSNIKLAAFIEILYDKIYLGKKNNDGKLPRKLLNDFCESFYNKNILASLKGGETKKRRSYLKLSLLKYFNAAV